MQERSKHCQVKVMFHVSSAQSDLSQVARFYRQYINVILTVLTIKLHVGTTSYFFTQHT